MYLHQNQQPGLSAQLIIKAILLLTAIIFKPTFVFGAPFELPPTADINKIRSAIIETEAGALIVELYPEIAPRHVANLKYLADLGFYRGTNFHIYKQNYIIQGGASAEGDLNTRYSIPAEFGTQRHTLGTVGMSRKPNYINTERRSSSTQFHILLNDAAHMDGEYTIFGRVVKGFNVLTQLRKGTVIKDVRVFVRKGS